MMNNSLFLLLFVFTICSCTNDKTTTPKTYFSALANHQKHITKSVDVGNYQYKISYQPIAKQLLRAVKQTDDYDKIQQAIPDFTGHRYFVLNISRSDGIDIKKELSPSQLQQIQFQSQPAFQLMMGGQKFPCQLYHYVSTGLPQQGIEIALVFADPAIDFSDQSETDITFLFEDQVFSNQIIAATFQAEDFNQLPTLKL